MDSQQTFDFLRKGLHVTLGATTALIESVQDPIKREENMAQLNLGFDEVTRLWEAKGEVTETEARQFIDTVISNNPASPPSAPTTTSVSTTVANPQVAADLQELTRQLAEMRAQLSEPQDTAVQDISID